MKIIKLFERTHTFEVVYVPLNKKTGKHEAFYKRVVGFYTIDKYVHVSDHHEHRSLTYIQLFNQIKQTTEFFNIS